MYVSVVNKIVNDNNLLCNNPLCQYVPHKINQVFNSLSIM